MEPKLAFCQFTSPNTSFAEDVELAEKFGFDGLSVIEFKLDGQDSEDARLLAESGLQTADCIPAYIAPLPIIPDVPFGGPEDPEERIELMRESVDRLARLSPASVIMCTGSGQGQDRDAAWEIAVRGLREAARAAARHDLRIDLEPIRDGGFDASFVHDLPESLRLLEEVGEPNLGLICDVWHLWDTPDILDHLERNASRIGSVHINDWLAEPASPGDRGFPGEGEIDLKGIYTALEKGGFDGWFNVEVFSSQLEGMPTEEIFQRSYDSFWSDWNSRQG